MKKIFGLSLFFCASLAFAQQPAPAPSIPAMQVTSTSFPDGGIIPVKFSQAAPNAAPGTGTSPQLTWTNVPAGTQSFVMIMHDVDVTRNKTTEDNPHWMVWNIPASTTSLAEGIPSGSPMADGSYQISATGPVYRGPGAAASGPLHHYVFEVYALDNKIDIKPLATVFETRKEVLKAIDGHVLSKGGYFGFFKRPQ